MAKEDEELKKIQFRKSDVEYLAQFAVGGHQRAAYKKWLDSFNQEKSQPYGKGKT